MNEWQELKIDNLPPDILTGDYEFQYRQGEVVPHWQDSVQGSLHALGVLNTGGSGEYRYRKPEPKQPSHEEIMTKWWFVSKTNLWKRIETFDIHCEYFIAGTGWLHRSWFTDKQSADIPPETL